MSGRFGTIHLAGMAHRAGATFLFLFIHLMQIYHQSTHCMLKHREIIRKSSLHQLCVLGIINFHIYCALSAFALWEMLCQPSFIHSHRSPRIQHKLISIHRSHSCICLARTHASFQITNYAVFLRRKYQTGYYGIFVLA